MGVLTNFETINFRTKNKLRKVAATTRESLQPESSIAKLCKDIIQIVVYDTFIPKGYHFEQT